jgi:hypothetical protein
MLEEPELQMILSTDYKPLALLLLFATGCGQTTGSISGTITYRGDPVADGTVSAFVAGKMIAGKIENGRYEIRGVPLGEAFVTVVSLDPNQLNPYDGLQASRKQMAEASKPGEKERDYVAEGAKLGKLHRKRHLIPIEYSATDTSDLHLTVTPGANNFNIDLQDRSAKK